MRSYFRVGDSQPEVWACTKCGEVKPFTREHFHPDKGNVFGLKYLCIPCHNARNVRYYQNPVVVAKRSASHRRYWQLNRERRAAQINVWRKAHPDRTRKHARDWYHRNPERARALAKARRKTVRGVA